MMPKFKYFHKPFLNALSSGEVLRKSDIQESITKQLGMSNKDKEEKTSSGLNVISDRVSWACVYLKKAGLIEQASRGFYKITELGLKVLNQNFEVIDNKVLGAFSEDFSHFQYIAGKTDWKTWRKDGKA